MANNKITNEELERRWNDVLARARERVNLTEKVKLNCTRYKNLDDTQIRMINLNYGMHSWSQEFQDGKRYPNRFGITLLDIMRQSISELAFYFAKQETPLAKDYVTLIRLANEFEKYGRYCPDKVHGKIFKGEVVMEKLAKRSLTEQEYNVAKRQFEIAIESIKDDLKTIKLMKEGKTQR